MKRERDVDEKFEWDISVITLIVLVLVGLLFLLMAVGPLGHVR